MLAAFLRARYATIPASRLRRADSTSCSRGPTRSMSSTPNPQELDTRSTATSMMTLAPGRSGRVGTQSVVRLVFGFVDRATAVETHYPRRVVEGAEHQRDAAVRSEVGYRLHATAGEIEPGDAVRVQDPEGVEPAGRNVDVGCRVSRSGSYEEVRLSLDPGVNSSGIFSKVCAMLLLLSSRGPRRSSGNQCPRASTTARAGCTPATRSPPRNRPTPATAATNGTPPSSSLHLLGAKPQQSRLLPSSTERRLFERTF